MISNFTDQIILMDCIEGMAQIPDKSIDCIICDLPYENLNKSNKNTVWDKRIPLDKLWEQYERIIKDNGAIILFGQGLFTAELMLSNKKMWRYNLVWDKDRVTGFLNARKMPLRCHEDILVFYKKLPTYNPQYTKGKPQHSRGKGVHVVKNSCYGAYKEPEDKAGQTMKLPKSIIKFKKEYVGKAIHPTQKPVDLIRWLIRTYTNEGETVLDNCIGGGTTAIAAIKEKRHYIGFENDQQFYDKAQERIKTEIGAI